MEMALPRSRRVATTEIILIQMIAPTPVSALIAEKRFVAGWDGNKFPRDGCNGYCQALDKILPEVLAEQCDDFVIITVVAV